MQSNPIQQRIELIAEKWEEAKKFSAARMVHIRCQPDERDMVDNFFTYMIGVDNDILDIAFHFDAVCDDEKLFGASLLEELKETMHIWNNVDKNSIKDYVPVNWKADRTLANHKNKAAMFVQNFNALARAMDLPKDLYAVAIFKGRFTGRQLLYWFKDAIEAGIDPGVKFLFHDTTAKPVFDELVQVFPVDITTIPLNLNMPKAMEQVAAMGDPNDPATVYRQTFMKMMNEMSAANEKLAEHWGQECIKTANQHIVKDPYWIIQVVVVYIALANDKVRHKKKEISLQYADKAVETALAAKTYFGNEVSSVIMAQALMFRGTLAFVNKQQINAYNDFCVAFELYLQQLNIPLAIEACRMAGESALKGGQTTGNIAELLTTGARLGARLDPQTARATTYPGLLNLLLQSNYTDFISRNELEEIATLALGENWMTTVQSWKQLPDYDLLKKQELEAAGA